MIELFGFTIIILGLINVLRLSAYFILGDWYDIRAFERDKNTDLKKYTPHVTILVPAHNEDLVIVRCLRSIYSSTYPHFDVVVVDDGSTDRTREVANSFVKRWKLKNLHILYQQQQGKAKALNFVLRKGVRGNLVMTLDADSVLHCDALKRAIVYFKKRDVVAIASHVRIFKSYTLLGAIQYIEYLLGYRLKKAYTVLNNEYIIGGIGAMFRRSALSRVAYYDTDTVTEDIDVTMKMMVVGNKSTRLVYASDVLCFTEAAPTVSALFRQRFRWKLGRFQTLFKHRRLLFNPSHRYSKWLTFFQLPFVLYSELTFLFDPLFFGLIGFYSIYYSDTSSFLWMFLFLGFYTTITIFTDEYASLLDKFHFLLVSPLAYFFFFLISIVEYLGLIRCIFDIRMIVWARVVNNCKWDHIPRVGALRA